MYTKKNLMQKVYRYTKVNDLERIIYKDSFSYFDENSGICREYFSPYTPKRLSKIILIDKKIENLINTNALSHFLCRYLDENSLMVLQNIAFIYEEDEEIGQSKTFLCDEHDDEYALESCNGMLGLTWVERQTIFINVKEILDTSIEICNDIDEFRSIENVFMQGLLSTIFHESRHLFYECNELIPKENNTDYPIDGGEEKQVEDYGNDMADSYLSKFYDLGIMNQECLQQFISLKQKNYDSIER